jgi:hypothetical protein
MTVIRPNSVSGINSITAQANEIKIFKSDGTQGGLVIGGANLNATSGISTVAALTVTGNVSVGGTLTYQDVTNIDSVGVVTARAGVHVTGGNVAVGHNNPSVNLHVKGSASNGQIYLGGTGAHSQIYADNDGVLILNADQGNSAANSYLGFNVDNSERVRIDSSGNMQVSSGQFTVGTTASTGLQLINDGTFGTIQSADLKIRTAATERLRITSAGLVGVNCTPLAQFQVKSGTNQNIALSSMSSEASIEAFNDAGSANVSLRLRGSDFKFYTSSTERVRITSAGDVQARRARSNTAGDVALSIQPSDSTIHYGFRIDSTNNNLNLDRVGSGNLTTFRNDGLIFAKALHVTDNLTPTSGRGVEIFEAATGVGQISSYNRDASSWDEFRIKGSEVRLYANANLRLDVQNAQSFLYGTSDGILNLDTTDGRGAFIRFKENGTTKAWIGCAEGMGGGTSSPNQDDLGLRATRYILCSAGSAERLRIQDAAEAVKVKGTTADTGTSGGSKGLTLQTGGGTSCPLYFGSETNSAQKSMYMTGYWIYLRGHQNEGIRFVFSQAGGNAPRSDQYQFKYNQATRPTGNTTWDGFSDRRAKENVQDVTSALDTIGRLRPVTFDWTNDYADRMNMFNLDKTDPRSYMWTSVKENGYDETRKNNNVGFIAQEFEEVFPKDITETEMELGNETITDFKTVNFDSLVPMLTKAVQELKAENDSLKARLDAAGL